MSEGSGPRGGLSATERTRRHRARQGYVRPERLDRALADAYMQLVHDVSGRDPMPIDPDRLFTMAVNELCEVVRGIDYDEAAHVMRNHMSSRWGSDHVICGLTICQD